MRAHGGPEIQPRYMELRCKNTELLMRLLTVRQQNGSRCMGVAAAICMRSDVDVCVCVCVCAFRDETRAVASHCIANEFNLEQICVAFLFIFHISLSVYLKTG